jgi:hypothetical protein
MLVRSDQRPPRGRIMLKALTKNMFNIVAALTIIIAVFYLAAITHILPLPESALSGEYRQVELPAAAHYPKPNARLLATQGH